jgi:hypothetical protein
MHFKYLPYINSCTGKLGTLLIVCSENRCLDKDVDCCQFVEIFSVICPVLLQNCNVLHFVLQNKFYVEVKLQTSLQAQLLDLFRQKVADSRMDTIMGKGIDV